MRREASQVSILEGNTDHAHLGTALFDGSVGVVSWSSERGILATVGTGRSETSLALRRRCVSTVRRSAKGLLTHVLRLETHVIATSHRALVTTVSAHSLTRTRTVHVVHAVMVHVGVTAHMTRVREVTTSSATVVATVVSAVSTISTSVTVTVVVHAEVHHTLLTLVSATTATVAASVSTARSNTTTATTVVVVVTVLFTLQLRLDSLAVRRVADHGKDGSNMIDEGHSLSRIGVVQSGLNDVVGKRISQQLF